MKKVYLIFSLLLMFLGINTVHATVNWDTPITNPSTLQAGDQIIIHTNQAVSGSNYQFLSSLVDKFVFTTAAEGPVDPYVVFNLETATGKTVNKEQAFYLKNDYNGLYVKYDFVNADQATGNGSLVNDADDNVEMWMSFTKDASQATPFIIKTGTEGAKLFDYTPVENDKVTDESMMIIAECSEHNNKLVALSNYWSTPYMATYADKPAYWKISIAKIVDAPFDDLKLLLEKVQNINYKGGNAPGAYDKTLVDAYNEAKTKAKTVYDTQGSSDEEAKAATKALEDAYMAILAADENPVTEGYYRITSAMPEYIAKQGEDAIKTVYATMDGKMKWKDLDSEDATMVWKFIDRHDGTWLLYNVGSGQYVNGKDAISQSANYTLTSDSTDCGVEITYLDQSQFNIKPSSYDIHTGGHNSGAGVSGDIVGWDGGLNGGSAWYIESVDESQIAGFEAAGKQNVLNRDLENLYNQANTDYQKGSAFDIDTKPEDWLVTTADLEADKYAVFSNSDHNSWNTTPDGSGYEGLLDADSLTYWHSAWQNIPTNSPYLQFKLKKPVSAFAVYITRRPDKNSDQATDIYFQVSKDTTSGEWISVGSINNLPSNVTGTGALVAYQSNGFELDGEYQFVKVTWKSAQGFTHFSGFHFEEATLSKDCQNVTLGDIASNLKTQLLNAAKKIDEGTATSDDIAALQKAYNDYKGKLADPTALKAKADSVQAIYETAATPSMKSSTGEVIFDETQPGVYTDAAKAALKTVLDDVQSYLSATESTGAYTKTDIDTHMAALTTALKTFKDSAPKFNVADENQEGTWYYLSASQHYYDVTGKTQESYPAENPTNFRKGKLYVDGDVNTENMNNAKLAVTGNSDLTSLNVSESYAKWRFVNLGDTAYAIQNQATGLYIGEKTGGNAGLSITPVAFKINDIGYATFILEGYRLNGAKTSPLHIQTNGQVAVFWNNYDLGNGSCFDIENTNEAANSDALEELRIEDVVKGKLYTKCYPVSINYAFDGIDSYASTYQIATIDTEKNQLTLVANAGDAIEAGTPFFYIGGGKELGVPASPTASDTTYFAVNLNINKVVAQSPKTSNGLVGTYYPTNVVAGFGIVKDTEGVQSIGATTKNQQIGWNSAYIDRSLITNGEVGEIVVPLSGDLQTAIKDAIIDAQTGNVNVYSIDGILIKKNVKVSEATKGLAKGIYIVGKQKVAVQ